MALLDQFMQNPATILGLSVLNQADRPAQGLLQGMAFNQRLQGQRSVMETEALRRDLMNQQILKNQQDAELAKIRQANLQRAQSAFTPTFTGSQVHQGMATGGPVTSTLFDRDPQAAINRLGQADPQAAINASIGLANAMKEGSPAVAVYTGDQPRDLAVEKASEAYGKGIGERINSRIDQAADAMRQNAQLDRMELAIARGGRTGFGQEFILNAQSLANTLGIDIGDPAKMGEQETIRTIGSEMALRLRNPESGLGLTGNTSNRDLMFLKSAVPGLDRTQAGNMKLIDLMRRFNSMKADVLQEQQRIIAANNGNIPPDIDTQLLNFVNNVDFLTEQEITEIENLKNMEPEDQGQNLVPQILSIE